MKESNFKSKCIFVLLVDVPQIDGAVEPRSDETIFSIRKFDVLHPVGMTAQGPQTALQVPGIPEGHVGVVRAGREQSGVQKSAGSLMSRCRRQVGDSSSSRSLR